MRRLALILLAALPACTAGEGPFTAADADRALIAGLNEGDPLSASELVDEEATWTDASGRTLTRSQLSDGLPPVAIMKELPEEAHTFDYGRVAVVRVDRDRHHAVRVWVRRPTGWRLLVYQEVESLASPPSAAPPGIGQECVNPCRTVPYQPKTDNERGVIAAYQALETAAHSADVDNWGRYVADEFVVVSSNSDRVLTKQARLDGLRKAAFGGVSPSPLVSAELFDFENAVVMRARHQPATGKPLQIGRVWVNRNGAWMSVLSYQTASADATQRD